MPSLKTHIHTFIKEVRRDQPLWVDAEGNFFVENTWNRVAKALRGGHQKAWLNAARTLTHCLNGFEKIPVAFGNDGVQVIDFQPYIEASELILKKLEGSSFEEKVFLERARVALLYRLETENGGFDPVESDPVLMDLLILAAQSWKSSQQIFHIKTLSNYEINILQEGCQFPLFIRLLLSDTKLLHSFFEWALRDKIAIRPFIEFPHRQQTIVKASLNGRIGRLGGDLLRLKKVPVEDHLEKILTLPFEGKDLSILDEHKAILFRGNYILTIREIFKVFENKKFEPGNLEFLRDGFINWNSHRLGWWDATLQEYQVINLEQPAWWNDLPILEILSLREARQKFGKHLTGREWNVAMVSARLSPTLDFEDAHSYTSIAIPQGDGRYSVYPFGKFATSFPQTMLEALFSVGKTNAATVAYPEENVYYTHRQKARYSYALTEHQGLLYMDSIKRDMLLSKEGNFVYQIESDNCAQWSHHKIEDALGKGRLPDVFQMRLLESEPHGVMEKVFEAVLSLPPFLQTPITLFIHLLLGAHKGRWIVENGNAVWKSLTHHRFWRDTVIFHPSMLHKNQEKGTIGRFVRLGVTLVGKVAIISLRKLLQCVEMLLRLISSLKHTSRAIFSSAWVALMKDSEENLSQVTLSEEVSGCASGETKVGMVYALITSLPLFSGNFFPYVCGRETLHA